MFLLRFCGGNVPFLPKIAPDGDAVSEVHAEHPGRRPAVEKPSVGRIGSIREPDGCEMGSPVIG